MRYKFLESFQLPNGVIVKNRIVLPPMTLRSSYATGDVTDAEVDFYRLRSGGPGMVIVEMAYVSKLGKSYVGQIGADSDDKIDGLKKIADVIKAQGALPILQLSFGGRIAQQEAVLDGQLVAPSQVPDHHAGMPIPRALTSDEIAQGVLDFGLATQRAIAAGFAGVEIHGANMYLIQQFFSPHANQRQDQWGGSLERRMAYGLAVLDEIIATRDQYGSPSFIVGYRQSPEEPTTPGIRFPEAVQMAEVIAQRPIDYFHLSLKSASQSPFMAKEDKEPLFEKYLSVLGAVPLVVAGLIRTPAQVEALVQAGIAGAAIGRELIIEPNWVQKVMAGDELGLRYALSPLDFDLLKIPKPLRQWLLTRFKNGLVMTTDAGFDPQMPWH
ncbi:NADH-dependent flavin oxidoreductase [Weissella diestrammenae]|uniref:NADH-dependent flavin oxidoreductase n=1 Tax=Weissella diestrammenae TaxID=1162633 RepID=A0A7G9T6E2_9LACO|nr:NADH-dependent flavin oxidoreductase [Weissella diestrammenae]MCM0583286.1 NADH-dependent flavin oxidoreductase [Weissella diestrammenae]QNN75667.1 NADH-dependent flavin oxidoreductase [Weissella diestrammenae]